MDSDIIDDNYFIRLVHIAITIDSVNIVVGTVGDYDPIVISIVVDNMLGNFYYHLDVYILFDDLIIDNSFS